MKQKQSSIDFFFSPKKDKKKALPAKIPLITNQEKHIEIKKPIDDDDSPNISDLLSRGSSPPPTPSLQSFEVNISSTESPKESQENQSEDTTQTIDDESVLTPEWQINQTTSKKESNIVSNSNDKEILLNNDEEKNVHWELEIVEHRIQFGKDLDHPHPAMAPNILKDEGLHDIRPREKTRSKHYEQINYIEYIPEFWQPRVWDDNYPKLNHAQSEFLLQSMIEAPFKEKKDDDSEYENQDSDTYSSSSSSPITSASNSTSDDDDDEKCEITSNRRSRIRFGAIQNTNVEKKVVRKPVLLRISSLLFDTDNEFETDLEDF